MEDNIAPGLNDDLIQAELVSLRTRTVSSLGPASPPRCGHGQSRLLSFSDGVHACAHYRDWADQQQVLGEVMSFYLARLLGLHYVPAVILSQVDPNHPVWRGAMEDVTRAGWRLGSMVAISQWIPHLVRTTMPPTLATALASHTTLDITDHSNEVTSLHHLNVQEAAELAQWSDLVVFDYITGTYDRGDSMQVSEDGLSLTNLKLYRK